MGHFGCGDLLHHFHWFETDTFKLDLRGLTNDFLEEDFGGVPVHRLHPHWRGVSDEELQEFRLKRAEAAQRKRRQRKRSKTKSLEEKFPRLYWGPEPENYQPNGPGWVLRFCMDAEKIYEAQFETPCDAPKDDSVWMSVPTDFPIQDLHFERVGVGHWKRIEDGMEYHVQFYNGAMYRHRSWMKVSFVSVDNTVAV